MTIWVIIDNQPADFESGETIVNDHFYVTKHSARKAMEILQGKDNYATQYYELRKLTLGRVP